MDGSISIAKKNYFRAVIILSLFCLTAFSGCSGIDGGGNHLSTRNRTPNRQRPADNAPTGMKSLATIGGIENKILDHKDTKDGSQLRGLCVFVVK